MMMPIPWLRRERITESKSRQALTSSPAYGCSMNMWVAPWVIAWVTAAVRCAPPGNQPRADERARCAAWLDAELSLLSDVAVIVALGQIGYHAVWDLLRRSGLDLPRPRPRFGHGAVIELEGLTLVLSYHPSQQNTFTGRLTEEMFDEVFAFARAAL